MNYYIMASSSSSSAKILPSAEVFQSAAGLAITLDKPIVLSYWEDSLVNKICIGIKEYMEDGEKRTEQFLVKSAEEYTSTVIKIYRAQSEFIVETENSIYIVSNSIKGKRIA